MTELTEPLPPFLAEPPRIGPEIGVTGKWTARSGRGRFRRPDDSTSVSATWYDVHAIARAQGGVVATDVNQVVGADVVLVHQRFADADALIGSTPQQQPN